MNVEHIRSQFPFFKQVPESLIYLDNAATTQKPQAVIDALVDYYTKQNANIHRGIYTFGEQATQLYEQARTTVARFIGAQPDEIIFAKNATQGINLVAYSWAMEHIRQGDQILLTAYEHHANILPWQRVAQKTGATLTFLPVHDDGTIALELMPTLLTSRTKLVAFSAVSNVTGAYIDIKKMVNAAHKVGAKLLVDAAQLVAHERIDVHKLNLDFLVFSAHKLFGPTGIGVVYIKKALQQQMVPYELGGGIVFDVDWEQAHYLESPQKFEAGTPPIAQAIGLAAAIDWLNQFDPKQIQRHEAQLTKALIEGLQEFNTVSILGPIDQLKKRGHIVSFIVNGIHPHDVAAFLNQSGIAVRAGHHCAQPLAKQWGIDGSVRVSFSMYNTLDEVQQVLHALRKLIKT